MELSISNQIMEGNLTCNCGEEYVITSGILTAGKSFETSDRAFLKILFQIISMKLILLIWRIYKEEENGRKRN